MAKYRIAVDEENNAEEWWDAVRDGIGGSFDGPIRQLLSGDEVVVDQEQRDQLLSHFRRLPGWAAPDAPDYARHPITVTEIDE